MNAYTFTKSEVALGNPAGVGEFFLGNFLIPMGIEFSINRDHG